MPAPMPPKSMHPVVAIALLLILSYLGFGRDPRWAELGFSFLMVGIPVLIIRGAVLFAGDISRIGRRK